MSSPAFASVAALEYRETVPPFPFAGQGEAGLGEAHDTAAAPMLTEGEVQVRIEAACAAACEQAIAATETRLRREWAAREAEMQTHLNCTLTAFATERAGYFRRVEAEVVHLSLAIARKVLGREAELDPTLLSALVRIALDRMSAGPAVRLRVTPGELASWQSRGNLDNDPRFRFELVGDPMLTTGECVVETDLGSANFGFDAQLKEIEEGFFDLLAQRPGDRSGNERARKGRSGEDQAA